jgi:peptidoglycan/xylan/chitin deacetylase (PgdA/CDA1 family)
MSNFEFGDASTLCDSGQREKIYITFDDGYAHLVPVISELVLRYQSKPLVFIPTAFIGRENSWDYSRFIRPTRHFSQADIRILSEMGVEFGSHGHRHLNLMRLSAGQMREELETSRTTLEDILEKTVTALSYPFGRHNQRVVDTAVEAGFRNGYTMNFPSHTDTAMTIGRFAVYNFDTSKSVIRKLSHTPGYRFEQFKANFANKLSGGTELLQALFTRTAR